MIGKCLHRSQDYTQKLANKQGNMQIKEEDESLNLNPMAKEKS
jgi:hypothetical protein